MSHDSIKTITAKELANILRKSTAWVYRHKHALGGFQPVPGGAVVFFENKIGELANAIQDEERQMASSQNDKRREKNKSFSNKKQGAKVGNDTDRRRMASVHDPHGIIGS